VNEETVLAWIEKAGEDLKIGQDELATHRDFPTPTLEEVQRTHELALMVRQFERDKRREEGVGF